MSGPRVSTCGSTAETPVWLNAATVTEARLATPKARGSMAGGHADDPAASASALPASATAGPVVRAGLVPHPPGAKASRGKKANARKRLGVRPMGLMLFILRRGR